MDVDPSSVNGETELNACMQVHQVSDDPDPPMWWKQHHKGFPPLTPMTTDYLTVTASSVSPERLIGSVGLVESDFAG